MTREWIVRLAVAFVGGAVIGVVSSVLIRKVWVSLVVCMGGCLGWAVLVMFVFR